MVKSSSLAAMLLFCFMLNLGISSPRQEIRLGLTDTAASGKGYPKEVADRIKQIEQHIQASDQNKDTPDYTLEQRMAHYGIRGLSIAVINNYQVEWAKGYGFADLSLKVPVTEETAFEACSLTKSFTAMGIMKLVDEKKLDLNTDINTYLKTWKVIYDKQWKNSAITIANLLSHTSGLFNSDNYSYRSSSDQLPTVDEILEGKRPAKGKPVHCVYEPGTHYDYGNIEYTVIRKIVDDVTNQPYDSFMKKTILQPLGMSHSFFKLADANSQTVATGYKSNGKEIKGKHQIVPDMAAGGLWSTPMDIAKYVIEMQLSSQVKSNKILTPEATQTMLTPYKDKNSALGTFIYPKPGMLYFEHAGNGVGFGSFYKGSLSGGKGVVIMCNSHDRAIIQELFLTIASVYHWEGFNPAP
jgi:CubicO group peptidase (beta-lactamase class C family)